MFHRAHASARFSSRLFVRNGRVASGPLALRVALLSASCIWPLAVSRAQDEISVKVPDGFTVSLFADDSLAHDIFSMTVDSLGRVVVSGPGYVKILIDTDGDGRADAVKQFADGPASGAQGMCFHGRDLLCTGDEGLIRYRDEDGDDRADGPPETFFKIKTGGEHNVHAIRRGPDGWWYVIAGNTAEVSGAGFARTSPVKQPTGGVLLRLKPDLSGGEILADGFRNAYDFDFDTNGELYVYDSDAERDISLPWYLPTRLLHVLPGANHGWVSNSWWVPEHVLDAAPVVAATGRGSPTGVVCYRHTQFPAAYRGGLFCLDWTFGRVLFVPLERKGDTCVSRPQEFMAARGQFGFAPTDIEPGTDGSLYISVGGRGTHGTVYRVTFTGEKGTGEKENSAPPLAVSPPPSNSTPAQQLAACLEPVQPLSSWSRWRWVPVATKLGPEVFLTAALNPQLAPPARVRAIEILTDLFAGLPATAADLLLTAGAPEVRARAAWSLGVKPALGLDPETLIAFLGDADPLVRRRTLEALPGAGVNPYPLMHAVAKCLNDDHRLVRLAAARIVPELDTTSFKVLSETARRLGWKAALTNALGYVWRTESIDDGYNAYALDIGRRILDGNHSRELKLEAIRLMQIAIGDYGPAGTATPVFDGYVTSLDLKRRKADLDPLRAALGRTFPSGERTMDLELSRLAAMLSPTSSAFLDKTLSQITDDSHPVDDIHYLIVAGRIAGARTKKQQALIAKGLVNLERKLVARKLNTDTNWNDRIGELYARLVELDPQLPVILIDVPGFGRPTHVIYLAKLPEKNLPKALEAFQKAITAGAAYPWNNDVVFVLGMGKKDEYLNLVRQQFDKFELRMAVLLVLAAAPHEMDRAKFAAGLDSQPIEVLTACVDALEKLPVKRDGEELVSLVKLFRRLGTEQSEFPLRERVVKLIQRNAKQNDNLGFVFNNAGYRPQPEANEKWTAWAMQEFPAEAARHLGGNEADFAPLKASLAEVAWDAGDVARGQRLFTARACAQCHTGGGALGPDLAGAAGRFSREDLFAAIALPNRDVSPRYQTTLVETKAGKVYTGLVVYKSVEGLLLRNGTNQTFRIEAGDIESQRSLPNSLMPGGLLKDLTPADLADLYSYLRSLTVRTAEATDPFGLGIEKD